MQIGLNFLGALAALVLLLLVPRRRATRLLAHTAGEGEPQLRLAGGACWFGAWPWPIGATWPLVSLEVFTWGLWIGPNFPWMCWTLPTTELSWSDIRSVRRTKTGLRLKLEDSRYGNISFSQGFGPGVAPSVVALIRSHGVPEA